MSKCWKQYHSWLAQQGGSAASSEITPFPINLVFAPLKYRLEITKLLWSTMRLSPSYTGAKTNLVGKGVISLPAAEPPCCTNQLWYCFQHFDIDFSSISKLLIRWKRCAVPACFFILKKIAKYFAHACGSMWRGYLARGPVMRRGGGRGGLRSVQIRGAPYPTAVLVRGRRRSSRLLHELPPTTPCMNVVTPAYSWKSHSYSKKRKIKKKQEKQREHLKVVPWSKLRKRSLSNTPMRCFKERLLRISQCREFHPIHYQKPHSMSKSVSYSLIFQ